MSILKLIKTWHEEIHDWVCSDDDTYQWQVLYPTSNGIAIHSNSKSNTIVPYTYTNHQLITEKKFVHFSYETKEKLQIMMEKEELLDKNIGTSRLRASEKASSPHGYQSTFNRIRIPILLLWLNYIGPYIDAHF